MDNPAVLDTKLLSAFIYELNIARRNLAAYPPQHPMVASSEQKVISLLQKLFSIDNEFSLGFTRETIIVANTPLDKQNPIYRDLARLFSGQGISIVTFSAGLTQDELHLFNQILSWKREQLRSAGGIASVVKEAGITHLIVQETSYDGFVATEDDLVTAEEGAERKGIWENFVRGLLTGNLDPWGRSWSNVDEIDCTLLSQIVSQQYAEEETEQIVADYAETITRFMQELRRKDADEETRKAAIDRFASFINNLAPDLRRQFLVATCQSFGDSPALAEEVLGKLSTDAILDGIEHASENQEKLPSFIFKIVQRLTAGAQGARQLPSGLANSLMAGEVSEKLKVIFREDSLEEFLPDSYQKTLEHLVTGDVLNSELQENPEEAQALTAELEGHSMEAKMKDILLEILFLSPDEDMVPMLQGNLQELAGYFLELGDFVSLVGMHDRLFEQGVMETQNEAVRYAIAQVFSRPEFVGEVLNGLGFWGKAKYEEIRQLITKVGKPFAGALLERLAAEQNLSLRRFYMDRLLEIGPTIQDQLLAATRDNRWYFVRNVLVLLRAMNDPAVVRHVQRLVSHPHAKVRQEVLRTLLHFGAPEADQILLQQLTGDDEEICLAAIQVAEKSKNREVFDFLISCFKRGKLTNYEYKLKSAVVTTLAEMGNPAALPVLEKVLLSGRFFHRQLHTKLKQEIMQTLDRYPAAAVVPVLRKVVNSGNAELTRMAEELYKNLQKKVR